MRTRNGMGVWRRPRSPCSWARGFRGPDAALRGVGDPRACAHGQQLERNVQTAINYYTLAFNAGQPRRAVELYVGVDQNGLEAVQAAQSVRARRPRGLHRLRRVFQGHLSRPPR